MTARRHRTAAPGPGVFADIKPALRDVLSTVGLLHPARRALSPVRDGIRKIRRRFGPDDRTVIEAYLRGAPTRKLHLGCGARFLPGWLNSDYVPTPSHSVFLDATKPFPLPTESFDYVFSEHMIEHIPYSAAALLMLRECHRVLRRGGKIRISTPNLEFVVGLYRNDTPLHRQYVDSFIAAVREWGQTVPNAYRDRAFVINHWFRGFGHEFVYDESTLARIMSEAGFVSIVKCTLQESESEPLRNIENEDRMPPMFVRLETMTFEGTKP